MKYRIDVVFEETQRDAVVAAFTKAGVKDEDLKVEPVPEPLASGVEDYDELLRDAVRLALRIDASDAALDGWDNLYDRIRGLMAAYVASPEGEGEDAETLMTRLAASVADVIPTAIRKQLVMSSSRRCTADAIGSIRR